MNRHGVPIIKTALYGLLLFAFAVCIAVGVILIPHGNAFAEEAEPAAINPKASAAVNGWEVSPSISGWKWGDFDEQLNVISAKPVYGNEEMYFRIYRIKDINTEGTASIENMEWIELPQSIELNGKDDFTAFRFIDGALPQYVTDTLRTLDANTERGNYCLVTTVPASEGNYYGLTDTHAFRVLSVENSITKLTIEQWAWGEYDYTANVINVDVAHGMDYDEDNNIIYNAGKLHTISNITYSIYYGNGEAVDSLSDFKIDEKGRVIDTQTRSALSSLGAGTYWLEAVTNDGNVNYADASMRVRFTIDKHYNYWTKSPSVLQWAWGEYDAAVNKVSGSARYIDKAVVNFGVFTDENCTAAVIPVFSLDKNGNVSEEVAKTLGGLSAGTYYLKGWTANDATNYSNCEGIVPFTVQKAQSRWTVSPYVISWEYGEYDKKLNLIKGAANCGAETAFSVYTDEACASAVRFSEECNGSNTVFVLGEDGLVPDYVAEKLKTLDKGTYYLLAVVDGTPNYFGINDGNDREPIPFEIRALDNYWTEAPGLIGWSEGRFSAFDIDKNLSGTAKIGDVKFTLTDENNNVLFVILTVNGKINSVQTASGEKAKLSDLNSLTVGAYKLLAEVEGKDNYSGLSMTASFAVLEDSVGLTGIIASVIVFAVLDIAAAGACIALLIIRRKKVEARLRSMINKELHKG